LPCQLCRPKPDDSEGAVDIEWTSIYSVKDGKATEHRAVLDLMGLMQQLGAMPSQ
jgi:hypothetical protein